MSYTISIPENSAFTGDHMGLTFTHGKAHTDDYFLASRLQSKGYTVTADEVAGGEAVHDSGEVTEAYAAAAEAGEIPLEEMTVQQLREHAAKNGIVLGGARSKMEIISAIYAAEAAHTEMEQ